jgi:hypothetical protein
MFKSLFKQVRKTLSTSLVTPLKLKKYGTLTAGAALVISSAPLDDDSWYVDGNIVGEDLDHMFQHGYARLKEVKLKNHAIKICNNIDLNSDNNDNNNNNNNQIAEHKALRPVEVTKGRFHLWLSTMYNHFLASEGADGNKNNTNVANSDLWKHVVQEINRKLKPFVEQYFHHHKFNDRNQYVMTQLQLLTSHPGSIDQFFHVDNTACGLTFVIALDDIFVEKGPTELLYKSYLLHTSTGDFNFSKSKLLLPSSTKFNTTDENDKATSKLLHSSIYATMKRGEIFVFDSRTLHRGLGNVSSESRPVIIIRYDNIKHLPPGSGILRTMLLKHLATFLSL